MAGRSSCADRVTGTIAIKTTLDSSQNKSMSPFSIDKSPDFILFAQHGWADTNIGIEKLAQAVATPKTLIVAPDLGYLKTWLRIEPLIARVEEIAIATVNRYPNTPIRIIGHSMGGLIWLEVLDRNPKLRSRVESLVLVASPIGGAHLARLIDPLSIGIGIARDLGINRRAIAQRIAKEIPTLVIAGDIDNGSDGTVTIECTKFDGAKHVCVCDIAHAALKNHSILVDIIKDFWVEPAISEILELDFSARLIDSLRSIPGMTDGHRRYLARSTPQIVFPNGISIRTWRNPLQVKHVFVTDGDRECLWSGFVGWLHAQDLERFLAEVPQKFSCKVGFAHPTYNV
jgi:hypothetical protein